MGFLYEVNSGSRVLIPRENELEALRSGRFSLPRGQPINVVRPDGRQTISVNPEDLEDMLSRGWHMEGPDEMRNRRARSLYGDMGGEAFLTGAARGLTFGLSDLALTGLDVVEPVSLDALRTANPGLSTTGELTGIAAGTLLPLGAAARGAGAFSSGLRGAAKLASASPIAQVGRLGGAVGRTVEQAMLSAATTKGRVGQLALQALSRPAGFATGGAIEGAIYGVGRTITESALGDPDAVGEALTAYVGPEAILGGMVGGAFGAASKLGGKLVSGLAQRAIAASPKLEQGLERSLRKKIFRDIFNLGDSTVNKMPKRKVEAFREALFDENILPDGAVIQPGITGKTAFKERLNEAAKYHGEIVGGFYGHMDELATQAGLKLTDVPRSEDIIKAIDRELSKRSAFIGPTNKSYTNILDGVRQELTQTGPWSFQQAWEQKRFFADRVPYSAKARADWTPEQEANEFLARIFNEEIDAAVDRSLAKIPAKLPNQPASAVQNLKESFLQSKRYYYAIADFAKEANKKTKLDAGEVVQMIRGYAGTAARSAAFRVLMPGYSVFSAVRGGLGIGAIAGAGGAAKRTLGGGTMLARADQFSRLGALQVGTQKIQTKLENVAKTFLQPTRATVTPTSIGIFRTYTKERDRKKAAESFAQRIYREASQPEMLAQKVTASISEIEEVAPNVAQAMGKHLATLIHTLLTISPKKQVTDPLQPFNEPLIASNSQLRRYERAVATILKPETFFDSVKDGTVSPEMILLFKSVYPKLFETFRLLIVEQVASSKKKISPDKRRVLEMLLEHSLPGSVASIARSQAAYQGVSQEPAQGKGVSGISIRGLDKTQKLADTRQTHSQRLE